MLVFATALPLKEHFDPTPESIHGLCAEGGSREPEEPEVDPTAGGSEETEEPGESSAVPEESQQQPEEREEGSVEAEEAKPFWVDYDEDLEMQVAAEKWEAEEGYQGDDPILVASTTSFSASNPWVLYDANVFCSKDKDGQVERSIVGEKTIILREWCGLLTNKELLSDVKALLDLNGNTMDRASLFLFHKSLGTWKISFLSHQKR
eukprot:s520_g3.t1